jgi:hypothetical protein
VKKVKKKCCRSKPRCSRCPVLAMKKSGGKGKGDGSGSKKSGKGHRD